VLPYSAIVSAGFSNDKPEGTASIESVFKKLKKVRGSRGVLHAGVNLNVFKQCVCSRDSAWTRLLAFLRCCARPPVSARRALLDAAGLLIASMVDSSPECEFHTRT
jgi:hypothetical protein